MRECFFFIALCVAYVALTDPAEIGDWIATVRTHSQGIETGTDGTERPSPKGESPVTK